MDPNSEAALRELFLQNGCCMAYVAVVKDGIEGIGSAFHVGDGVFMTARHVVENSTIKEIRLTNERLFYRSKLYAKRSDGSYTIDSSSQRVSLDLDGKLSLSGGPFFHPSPEVDLAAFRVKGIAEGAPFVTLGTHWDDWIGNGDFELSRAIVLGYPPIPLTLEPLLVVAACEVNAVVDLRIGRQMQPHFILSAIPRGGFSGGLAMSAWGFAIGVVTQSLLNSGGPPETGFFTVTSIEAVVTCLTANDILPKCQLQS